MKFNPDDPKWTAYVLEELSPAERTAVEQELLSSAAAREIVEEIRQTTLMLKTELAGEEPMRLAPHQVRAIHTAATKPVRSVKEWRWLAFAGTFAAAAALVLFTIVPDSFRSKAPANATARLDGATPRPVQEPPLSQAPSAPRPAGTPSVAAPASAAVEDRVKSADRETEQIRRPDQAATESDAKADKLESVPLKEKVNEQSEQQVFRAQQHALGQAPYAPQAQQTFTDTSAPGELAKGATAGAAELKRTEPVAAVKNLSPVPSSRIGDARLESRSAETAAGAPNLRSPFINVSLNPRATFSIESGFSSYASVRSLLNQNQLPPKESLRIGDLINSFQYDYPVPDGEHSITVSAEIAAAPWQTEHRLIRVGIRGKEADGMEIPVAKDVNIQIDFNPAAVSSYRLVGSENVELRRDNNNRELSPDLSSVQTVTTLFEVIPRSTNSAGSLEILNLMVRYTDSRNTERKTLNSTIMDRGTAFASATTDFRFAAAVALFGMVLNDSPYKGSATLDMAIDIAERSRGADRNGQRDEFIRLVRKARSLQFLQ